MVTLRAIVGGAVTCFVGVYIFWFIIPLGKTEYTSLLTNVNKTSPTMQQLLPITDSWWLVFPLIIAVCLGYVIWSYATGNDPFDYGG